MKSGEAEPGRSFLIEHNLLIVWKPEYDLDIPIVDEQHRGIVTIINSLHYGMQNNYVSGILMPISEMLQDYTRIHFRLEEEFLEKMGFPDLDGHRALHRELAIQLDEVRKESIQKKDPHQLMRFLKSWWMDHICKEDRQYGDYYLELKPNTDT